MVVQALLGKLEVTIQNGGFLLQQSGKFRIPEILSLITVKEAFAKVIVCFQLLPDGRGGQTIANTLIEFVHLGIDLHTVAVFFLPIGVCQILAVVNVCQGNVGVKPVIGGVKDIEGINGGLHIPGLGCGQSLIHIGFQLGDLGTLIDHVRKSHQILIGHRIHRCILLQSLLQSRGKFAAGKRQGQQ